MPMSTLGHWLGGEDQRRPSPTGGARSAEVRPLEVSAQAMYSRLMNPEDIRRMVAGWQAVNEREREERRKAGPDSAAAIQGALELMDLFDEMHGWPPPEMRLAAAATIWRVSAGVRVRNYYRAHGKTAKPKDP